MMDGEGAGAAAIAGEGEGAGQGGGAGGEGGGGATPTWRDSLPDDLKNDATLSKYADLETFARGHLETKKLASSKLALPGEGATDEDWGNFWNSIGRPESPDKYDVPMIELPVDATDEQRAARDEALKPYREVAHRIGLTQKQASELAQFDLDRLAAVRQQGEAELSELQTKLGKDYAPKLAAAQAVAKQIFGDDIATLHSLDQAFGSGRFVSGMMRLAELAGEAKLIDGDSVDGFGEVKDADAKITELQGNKEWRDKFKAGDEATVRQYNNLLELAKRQALRGARGQLGKDF